MIRGAEPLIKPHQASFLEEQLNLYSDLAVGRNYLWKTFLESRFPQDYVFKAIWNQEFSKSKFSLVHFLKILEIRAALCTLALTVYIDHEPFNQLNLPKMCRVYSSKGEKTEKTEDIEIRSNKFAPEKLQMQSQLLSLIENIVNYLNNQVRKNSNENL